MEITPATDGRVGSSQSHKSLMIFLTALLSVLPWRKLRG